MRRSAALLNQRGAAAHCELSVWRFRRILGKGEGPPVFNPDGGRPLYAPEVLDAWRIGRDDRTERGAA